MALQDELRKISKSSHEIAAEKKLARQKKKKEDELLKQQLIGADSERVYNILVDNLKYNASNGKNKKFLGSNVVRGEACVSNDNVKYIHISKSTSMGKGVFRTVDNKKRTWQVSVTEDGMVLFNLIKKKASLDGIQCELKIMCRREKPVAGYDNKITETTYHRPGATIRGLWDELEPYMALCIHGKTSY